jgi:hypothetical protein
MEAREPLSKPQPPPVVWSISTKERGVKPNKTPSLEEPSPGVTPQDGGKTSREKPFT